MDNGMTFDDFNLGIEKQHMKSSVETAILQAL